MLELNLNEIWNANDIAAPTHYKKVKTALQGKYKSSSSKIIQRYRNLFWIELLSNFILFLTILYLTIRSDGIEKIFEETLFKGLIDWVGNSLFTEIMAIILLFAYGFYHWVFYFKYFKDFNQSISATRGLDVYSALNVSIKSIQKFRERTIRFGLLLLIVGTLIRGIEDTANGEPIPLTIFIVLFSGVLGYAVITGYYDYLHKPYQVDLEILQRQLEQE
jgi:hypothetical protein